MKRLLLFTALILLPTAAFSFGTGMEGCTGDCTACHKVKQDEVTTLLHSFDPALSVDEVKDAPVRGLYQLRLRRNGQPAGIAYLDFGKKHLLVGDIINLATREDLTRKSFEESLSIDVSRIDKQLTLVMGNPQGKKVLYLFTDPECPFCGKLHEEVKALVAEDKDLKVTIVLTPLPMHPDAVWKSQTILCAARKDMARALSLLDDSFAKKAMTRAPCVTVAEASLVGMAKQHGIGSTPTMAFADGKVALGFKKKEEIARLLQLHGDSGKK
jgi:thiol:disulfide interchange protein DsbC